jgi:hypothetical protein
MTAKNKLPIYEVENLGNMSSAIAFQIIGTLRRNRLYRPDLMYRGLHVAAEDLWKVEKYGTDRNPEDAEHRADEFLFEGEDANFGLGNVDPDAFESREEMLRYVQSEAQHIRKTAREYSNPNLIWALPQQGMNTCIRKYALDQVEHEHGRIPLVIVYRPEHLLYHGTGPDTNHHGETLDKLEIADMLVEDLALYMFKPGKTPLEAAVAGFRF